MFWVEFLEVFSGGPFSISLEKVSFGFVRKFRLADTQEIRKIVNLG